MARTKSPRGKKHSNIHKLSKGFKHARRRRIKAAKEAILHAGQYAYVGRKLKKRDLRNLWVIRLNAQVRKFDISYSKFISGLKSAKIEIDRKILSELVIKDPKSFDKIVENVKKNIK